jgi:hypothetical protein
MNILADLGDNGKFNEIEVLISEKGIRFSHSLYLQVRIRTSIEIVENPTRGEGINQIE